jgi:hypothetical protein
MAGPQIPKDFRRVIVAASVGNVIEWYSGASLKSNPHG